MNNHHLTKHVTLSALFLWLALFALFPAILIFAISFLSHNELHLIVLKFTLANYQQLFTSEFIRILRHSILLAALCTFITLLMAYPFALFLITSRTRFKKLLLLLIIIPFWTSSLIRTYAILILMKAHGLINELLLSLGIIHQPLAILYSDIAVIIGLVYNLLPFMVLPIYNSMEKLDHTLFAAAHDLGASHLMVFRKITLPLTLPGIIVGVIFVFFPAMTLFYIPDLLGGAKSLLLGNLIKMQFLDMNNWPGGAATSVVLSIILLIIAGIYRQLNRQANQRDWL